MEEAEPAGAVDGPARIEHHRSGQRQKQPMVGEDPDGPKAARHGGEQNGSGEHCADRHPQREISDLSLALGHLVVFG